MYLARTCTAKSLSLSAQHAQHVQRCLQTLSMCSMHIAGQQCTACTALSAHAYHAQHAQHTVLPLSTQHARQEQHSLSKLSMTSMPTMTMLQNHLVKDSSHALIMHSILVSIDRKICLSTCSQHYNARGVQSLPKDSCNGVIGT